MFNYYKKLAVHQAWNVSIPEVPLCLILHKITPVPTQLSSFLSNCFICIVQFCFESKNLFKFNNSTLSSHLLLEAPCVKFSFSFAFQVMFYFLLQFFWPCFCKPLLSFSLSLLLYLLHWPVSFSERKTCFSLTSLFPVGPACLRLRCCLLQIQFQAGPGSPASALKWSRQKVSLVLFSGDVLSPGHLLFRWSLEGGGTRWPLGVPGVSPSPTWQEQVEPGL